MWHYFNNKWNDLRLDETFIHSKLKFVCHVLLLKKRPVNQLLFEDLLPFIAWAKNQSALVPLNFCSLSESIYSKIEKIDMTLEEKKGLFIRYHISNFGINLDKIYN